MAWSKEKRRDYDRKRKYEIRKRINNYKARCKCAVCGETHVAVLDFHHKDPSKKDFSLSAAARNGYSWKRIVSELRKCICLCANHHRILHYELEHNGNNNERKRKRTADRRQSQAEAWQTQGFKK